MAAVAEMASVAEAKAELARLKDTRETALVELRAAESVLDALVAKADKARVDVDDANGFGPETITITNTSPGIYSYFINRAAGVGTFMGFMSGFRKHLGLVEKIAGALLVLSGLMFITGGVQAVSYWLIERFPILLNLG